MKIIANFSYAGTGKYVSHAVEDNRTLCGMSVTDLFARNGQEWDYVEEEKYLGITHKHTARDVGCLKCSRLLTQRAVDWAKAGEDYTVEATFENGELVKPSNKKRTV